MGGVVAPRDEAGVVAAIRGLNDGSAFCIRGGGRLEGFGRPVDAAHVLDLSEIRGIEFYRPGELVFRARAATPLAEAEAALAEAGQAFPFEPPDLGQLLGNPQGRATLGGLVAANLSGPARIARGALRDSLIGVRIVDGRGEVIRGGGRVMKNVTGLDLVKLVAGAHGTLGVLTEVTFKVLPRAETETTLVLTGLGAERAAEAMSAALASPLEVSAAAWLPAAVAARSGLDGDADAVVLRLESFAAFLPERARKLARHLARFGPTATLDTEASRALWREVRDVTPLAEPAARSVWRLSVAPAAGPALLDALREATGGEGFADWAGGLLWLAVPGDVARGGATIRSRLRAVGGYATLVRAPVEARREVPVFEPQAAPIMALTERLKASCDPARRLNPGRMYDGV